jgi:hypothetical protein
MLTCFLCAFSSSQTQLKSQVATVLNEAITTINTLLGHISVDVAKQPEIAALLSSTDSSLVKVISNASKLVSGLLATLVAKLGGTNLTSSLGQGGLEFRLVSSCRSPLQIWLRGGP